jgi:hypothetical protein
MKTKMYTMMALVLVFCSTALSWGAVKATYVPNPDIRLATGTRPFKSSELVARLGTLAFVSTDGNLYSPAIRNMAASLPLGLAGPVACKGSPAYKEDMTFFRLVGVARYDGTARIVPLVGSTGYQMLASHPGNLDTALYEVDLYLVGEQDSGLFREGARYRIAEGSLGSFNAAASTGKGRSCEQDSVYIPVNGQQIPADGSAPAPVQIAQAGLHAIPFGTAGGRPSSDYRLHIVADERFSIYDAIGKKTAKVADTLLIVTGTPHAVDIAFTGAEGESSFCLTHEDGKSLPPIPYILIFDSVPVESGIPIRWDRLSDGRNKEEILLSGIDANVATMAVSGSYSDTIYVTVTPVDSY